MIKRIFMYLCIILLVFTQAGCESQAKLAKEGLASIGEKDKKAITFFAMDTIMEFTAYGENADEAILEGESKIYALEKLLSATKESSDVYNLNLAAGTSPVLVSKETRSILAFAKKMSEVTGSSFDITIAPIVNAWGFTKDEKRVPSNDEIKKLLEMVDSEKLEVNEEAGTAFLKKTGMEIDLGAIAKGYSSDVITNLFKENGVTSAILSLGGNISAIGKRPNGNNWNVALKNPENEEDYLGVLHVSDVSVITSGGYQRFFEQDGKKYHHIIDPKIGIPAENNLLSVTIISENGMIGDCLSTALFVMGENDAIDFWRKSDDFQAVFVTKDKRVLVTEKIADNFSFNGEKNGYSLEIIKK